MVCCPQCPQEKQVCSPWPLAMIWPNYSCGSCITMYVHEYYPGMRTMFLIPPRSLPELPVRTAARENDCVSPLLMLVTHDPPTMATANLQSCLSAFEVFHRHRPLTVIAFWYGCRCIKTIKRGCCLELTLVHKCLVKATAWKKVT